MIKTVSFTLFLSFMQLICARVYVLKICFFKQVVLLYHSSRKSLELPRGFQKRKQLCHGTDNLLKKRIILASTSKIILTKIDTEAKKLHNFNKKKQCKGNIKSSHLRLCCAIHRPRRLTNFRKTNRMYDRPTLNGRSVKARFRKGQSTRG